jgi:hypothetical protein
MALPAKRPSPSEESDGDEARGLWQRLLAEAVEFARGQPDAERPHQVVG